MKIDWRGLRREYLADVAKVTGVAVVFAAASVAAFGGTVADIVQLVSSSTFWIVASFMIGMLAIVTTLGHLWDLGRVTLTARRHAARAEADPDAPSPQPLNETLELPRAARLGDVREDLQPRLR